MENNNILNKKHIHFIGICGISMSSLALLLVNNNIKITGSDIQYNQIVKDLRTKKIKVTIGHCENNIEKDCDLVVYTGAIKEDNIELLTAKQNNIQTMERSEFLGLICKLFKKVIAVAGTHGKTTTTAMIAHIFSVAGLKPTVHIGGISNNFNSNMLIGNNDYFITEACEYRNSFKYIKSDTCVITSTEPDHLDTYKNVVSLKNAYINFAKNSNNIITTSFVKNINCKKNIVCVGLNFGDLYAKNLKCNEYGCCSFDCWNKNKYLANFKLNVIGEYNVYNALCAIAVALEYKVSVSVIYDALKSFKGVARRNEKIGEIDGIPLICDYAHHPTEIQKTICANRLIYKNILCVFQPHTYSRTLIFKKEFANCFRGVKKLLIYKTYPAREQKIDGGDAKDLFKVVKIKQENKYFIESKYKLKSALYDNLKNIDCILILGAGNIYNIAKNVFKS